MIESMKLLGAGALSFSSFCRGAALFFGCFVSLNLLAAFTVTDFDANLWWIDLRLLPGGVRMVASIAFAATMLNYALRLRWGRFERRVTGVVVAGAVFWLLANTIEFYLLLAREALSTACPVPVTLIIALLAMLMTLSHPEPPRVRFTHVFTTAALFAACFAFLQMLAFGKTDYTRKSDIAVVFGARVYADGTLSDAVMDRVTTGCRLYREGYVRTLVFSGGPGDGEIHETEGMKRFAQERGVPASAIILDRAGLNTRSTAQNTTKIFNEHGIKRVLAVSHFYHLPRVKLAYQQEGFEVFTVPARSDRTLLKLPIFMAREGLAILKYYFEPFLSDGRIERVL